MGARRKNNRKRSVQDSGSEIERGISSQDGQSSPFYIAHFGSLFDPHASIGTVSFSDGFQSGGFAENGARDARSATLVWNDLWGPASSSAVSTNSAEAQVRSTANDLDATCNDASSAREDKAVPSGCVASHSDFKCANDGTSRGTTDKLKKGRDMRDDAMREEKLCFEMEPPKRRFNEVPEPERTCIAKPHAGLPKLQFQAATSALQHVNEREANIHEVENMEEHTPREVDDRSADEATPGRKGFGAWLRKKKK